jgi:hypothetical protein
MAQLIVTCPECGLRGELTDSKRQLDDPSGECKHHLIPAKCPALRAPLIGARPLLDWLEWDVIMTGEGLRPSPSIVPNHGAPDLVYEE